MFRLGFSFGLFLLLFSFFCFLFFFPHGLLCHFTHTSWNLRMNSYLQHEKNALRDSATLTSSAKQWWSGRE